jgi:hypothetical protein
VTQLVAAIADFAVFVEQAVHGADGTEVGPLVQQRGVDLGWGLVGEAFGVERHDLLALRGREGPVAPGSNHWGL